MQRRPKAWRTSAPLTGINYAYQFILKIRCSLLHIARGTVIKTTLAFYDSTSRQVGEHPLSGSFRQKAAFICVFKMNANEHPEHKGKPISGINGHTPSRKFA
jgi:hypothetical protein